MPKYIAKINTNKGVRYFYDSAAYDAYRRSASTVANAQLNNVNASNAFNNAVAGQYKLKPIKKQSTNAAQKVSDAKRAKQALYKLPKNDLMRRIKRTLTKRATRKQKATEIEKAARSHTTMGKANKIASDIIPGAKYHVISRAVLGSTSKTPTSATKQAVNNSIRVTAPYRIKKHK